MLSRLIQAEFNRLKAELGWRAKNLAFGLLMVIVAVVTLQFLLFALLYAAVSALALVMPAWAAGLVVAGALLLVILGLVAAAVKGFKNAGEELDLADSWQEDIDAIQGMGPYDR